jgi:transposase-like protein
VPFEVALSDLAEQPCYQKIANEAVHLYRLGMNANRIAASLKVDRTTVVRALRWLKGKPRT